MKIDLFCKYVGIVFKLSITLNFITHFEIAIFPWSENTVLSSLLILPMSIYSNSIKWRQIYELFNQIWNLWYTSYALGWFYLAKLLVFIHFHAKYPRRNNNKSNWKKQTNKQPIHLLKILLWCHTCANIFLLIELQFKHKQNFYLEIYLTQKYILTTKSDAFWSTKMFFFSS